MYVVLISLQLLASDLVARVRVHGRDDRGQSTAEYALVLLGAAAVAMLLVAWATKTGKVTDLLDGVLDSVLDKVK
jgi:hypothetical protein